MDILKKAWHWATRPATEAERQQSQSILASAAVGYAASKVAGHVLFGHSKTAEENVADIFRALGQ